MRKKENNMFDKKLSEIEFGGKKYPYKCDLVVLERIQTEIGDVIEFEESIRGIKRQEDGTVKYVVPNVANVCKCFAWMIEEGIEITGEKIEPLTEDDLKRQDEYTLMELSVYAFEEYNKCFLSKRGEVTETTDSKKKASGKKGKKESSN